MNRRILFFLFTVVMSLGSLQSSFVLGTPDQWVEKATNCTEVPNNVDATLPNPVYLGVGPTVPADIQQQYPGVSAQYLEDFKTGLVGLRVGELKSIMIPSERGYGDGDLFFDLKVLQIYNDDGSGITKRSSVVQVWYSLYRDCVPLEESSSSTSAAAGTGTSDSSSDNTNLLFIGGGVVGGLILFGGTAFLFMRRNPSNITQSTVKTHKKRQERQLKSLRDIIHEQEADTHQKTQHSSSSATGGRTSRSRRRR